MSSKRTEENTSPLHKAIKIRNLVKIKTLLKSADINEKNNMGYTPLLYACMQPKNDEMLEILFQQDNIDPILPGDEGESAVHILAFNGQLKWIKRYFEKFPKVPVDILTDKQDTPLIYAAKMDHSSVILYLYENGANINHTNNKNFTALHYAANNGYLDSLELLISLGAELNACDNRGCTPLEKACGWGFTETCKLLLESGANIKPTESSSKCSLSKAIFRNHLDIVELLLHHGADPNLEVKVNEYHTNIPLSSARTIEVLKLLIKYKANINYPGKYSLPLFTFIKQGFVEGVQLLIDEGVNLHGRHSQTGKTAMEYAKGLKKNNIVQLLKKYY